MYDRYFEWLVKALNEMFNMDEGLRLQVQEEFRDREKRIKQKHLYWLNNWLKTNLARMLTPWGNDVVNFCCMTKHHCAPISEEDSHEKGSLSSCVSDLGF